MENREGQRPLVRLRRRWEGNTNIELQEIGLRGGAWAGWIWIRMRTVGRLL